MTGDLRIHDVHLMSSPQRSPWQHFFTALTNPFKWKNIGQYVNQIFQPLMRRKKWKSLKNNFQEGCLASIYSVLNINNLTIKTILIMPRYLKNRSKWYYFILHPFGYLPCVCFYCDWSMWICASLLPKYHAIHHIFHCLFSSLIMRTTKKTSQLPITGPSLTIENSCVFLHWAIDMLLHFALC